MQKNIITSTIQQSIKQYNYNKAKRPYLNLYKRILQSNSTIASNSKLEKEWMRYWKRYDSSLSPLCFRAISPYLEKEIDIIHELIPWEYIVGYIEPTLNPQRLRAFYGNKNNFGHIIPKEAMPKTFIRNINGLYYDEEYKLISEAQANDIIFALHKSFDKIIVKPTYLDSGVGVRAFLLNGEKNILNQNTTLTIRELNNIYHQNYIVQEGVDQHPFMSQFNCTSVNTVRMATYRDLNGNIRALSAVLRIGKTGSVVDNAHGGGKFTGLSSDGKLKPFISNHYGVKESNFNNINFTDTLYAIPNFNEIVNFASKVSTHIIDHNLIALDIALKRDGYPTLLEYNVGGFSSWIFNLGGESVFKQYTHEIIERSYADYQTLQYPIISRIPYKQ